MKILFTLLTTFAFLSPAFSANQDGAGLNIASTGACPHCQHGQGSEGVTLFDEAPADIGPRVSSILGIEYTAPGEPSGSEGSTD